MCDRSHLKGADDPLLEMLLSEGDDLDAAHVQRFLHRIMKIGRAGVPLREVNHRQRHAASMGRMSGGESPALIDTDSFSPRKLETYRGSAQKNAGQTFARPPGKIILRCNVFRKKGRSTQ